MPIPRVAIVGRPNAGKSSLMNMIAGAKVSIVDPTPGVTRDRVSAIVDITSPPRPARTVEFVDTGGFGVYTKEGGRFDEVGADLARLTQSIERQIALAVASADLVLFAVDCQQGLSPADEQIARMLRDGGFMKRLTERDWESIAGEGGGAAARAKAHTPPPIHIVATKVDGPRWEAHAYELAALGFGEPLMCSAKNNYMRRDFMERVYDLLPAERADEDASALGMRRHSTDLMLAIVGKRNAGKSTLVNTLAGEERVIVSEIAGTTRDAVDVRFDFGGRSLVAIDTAGLRRKKSFQDAIEHFAFDRAQRAIDRADVVLLLIDAGERISQVDEQLAALVQKSYKPAIIVVNKWDLAEGAADFKGRPATPDRYEEYIRKELQALWFAPIAFIQASVGRNVRAVVDLAFELKAQSEDRVTTGKLNRFVRGIFETQGPTDTKGTHAKLYYVAQTGIAPPTITLVVNHPELFRPNYIRFLMNRFRESLPFQEVPMRIVIRSRRQREDDLAAAAAMDERNARAGARDAVADAFGAELDDESGGSESRALRESEQSEGPIRVKRGRKGMDPRARQRAEEQGIPSDEQLLAEFDEPAGGEDSNPRDRAGLNRRKHFGFSDDGSGANGASHRNADVGEPDAGGDNEALMAQMLADSDEHDTGYDAEIARNAGIDDADEGPREPSDADEPDVEPAAEEASPARKPQARAPRPIKKAKARNSKPAKPARANAPKRSAPPKRQTAAKKPAAKRPSGKPAPRRAKPSSRASAPKRKSSSRGPKRR